MATFGKLEGRITFASAQTGTINDGGGADVFTVAAGSYYLSSGDTDGAVDLIAAFENALNAATGPAMTVTIDTTENGTGKVTITGASDIDIAWTTTPLRDVLGFGGNMAGTDTYTSDYQARSLWLPNTAFLNLNGGGQWRGWQESDLRVVENAAGYVWAHSGQRKRVMDLAWQGIKRSKCWATHESTLRESLEQFYIDVVLGEAAWSNQPCGPIRFYPDADADYIFGTYKIAGGLEMFKPAQLFANYGGQWIASFPRMVQVPNTETLGLSDTIVVDDFIDAGTSTTDGTTFTTATGTATSSEVLAIVFWAGTRAGSVETPVLTGGGLTWTSYQAIDVTSGNRRLNVFTGVGTYNGGALTATYSQAHLSAAWCVLGLTGSDRSGTAGTGAFRQTNTQTSTAATSTTTMIPLLLAKNLNLTAFCSSGGTVTPDADFTELTSQTVASNNIRLSVQYAEDEFVNTTTLSGSNDIGHISIEIKAATS